MTTQRNVSTLAAAQQLGDQLVAWRRSIHMHPELGFEVFQTAELVAGVLTKLDIPFDANVGKTGIVAYLGDAAGPTIAIRADMDALPIQEENDISYASTVPGVMHACGHDAHVAMLLGVAALLKDQPLPGQVRLLFQPSEEGADEENLSGAQRMISDNALEGVEVVIAQHVDGTLDTGHIRLQDGFTWAAVDSFNGHVIGQGGHGAYPHQTVDPIWLSSLVLNALYAIPSRRVDPLQSTVVTVGVIKSGTANNIIPGSVDMQGTLRSYDDAVREQLIQEVENAFAVTRALGGDFQLDIRRGYPAAYNHPQVAGWIRLVVEDFLGTGRVNLKQSTMGGEDFAYMMKLAKGAMFRLGVREPGGMSRHLHTPTFNIDEKALPVGTAILAETALRYVHRRLA